MISQRVIEEAVRILRESASPSRIILFGSYARGDPKPHSDLDLLVIHRGWVDKRAERVRLREALLPLKVPVDVMVVTEEEVKEYGHLIGTSLYPALKEGKVLYDTS